MSGEHRVWRPFRTISAAFGEHFGLGCVHADLLARLYLMDGQWARLWELTDAERGVAQERIRVIRQALECEALDTLRPSWRVRGFYRLTDVGLRECRQALASQAEIMLAVADEPLGLAA